MRTGTAVLIALYAAAFISAVSGTAISAPGTTDVITPARSIQRPAATLSVGLLLLAIDAQPDHLRISEAMRVVNAGPVLTREVRFVLPRGAAYVTFHRGIRSPRDTGDGFADTIPLRTGITEIAYSYALPAGNSVILSRVFPFPVQRMEIVARGPGVRLTVPDGVPLPPLRLGDQWLARWERRNVAAGAPVGIALDGLPASPTWLPGAAAAVLAVALAAGLIIAAQRYTASRQ